MQGKLGGEIIETVIDDLLDDFVVGEASDRMGEAGHEWNGAEEVVLQHILSYGGHHLCGLESLCSD